MMNEGLDNRIVASMGAVSLRVADLEQMIRFYVDIIGMEVNDRTADRATLGTRQRDLLTLIHKPDAPRIHRTTGLYHYAILTPSRYDLARSLKRLAETQYPVQGMSDHAVSEAIYLADPEGNGIEIYRDRPRSEWYRDGKFLLTTVALDVNGVIGTLNNQDVPWTGLHADTMIGHVHLHVGAIPQAEAFYRDLLGFDIMMNIGSATFLAYDGYHHHLGANTWSGNTPPPEDALGLDHYVMNVGHSDRLQSILARLDTAGLPIIQQEDGYLVADPWRNQVILTAAGV